MEGQSHAKPAADITVVGEAIVDLIHTADGTRRRPGGSPLNVAIGLGRLGVPTRLVSQVGDDEDGRVIREHLRNSGVGLEGLITAPRTSRAIATINADGSAEYEFDIEWSIPIRSTAEGRLLHFGSIAAIMEPGASAVKTLIQDRAADQFASFDPNIREQLITDASETRGRIIELMAISDIVKLSDEDASWVYPGATPDEALERILSGGSAVAALTLGGKGAILRTTDARVVVPTRAGTVVDTVGAGDSFMAGLLFVALEHGLPESRDETALHDMARFASNCSAVIVSRTGADLPWLDELPAEPEMSARLRARLRDRPAPESRERQ